MTESKPEQTTGNAVFSELLKRIASGEYAAGERLPAERELARILGASRPTLREALRRLSQWHMVEAKRGSGVVVLEKRYWTIEALPAFMRFGKMGGDNPTLPMLISDLLRMRHGLMLAVAPVIASGRIPPGGTERTRKAIHHAWENRNNPQIFANAELEMLRSLAEAANLMPWVWMLNSLGAVYVDLASTLAGAAVLPDDFVPSTTAFLDAVEAGDPEKARDLLDAYIGRTDKRMIQMLETMA